MENDAVEKKDSDLLTRVHELREKRITEVDYEQELPKTRKVWPLIFFALGVSLVSILVFFIVKTDTPPLPVNSAEKAPSKKVEVAQKPPEVMPDKAAEEIPKPSVAGSDEKRERPKHTGADRVEDEKVSDRLFGHEPKAEMDSPEADTSMVELPKDTKITSPPKPPKVLEKGGEETYVADMAVAKDVFNLNPVGRQNTFSVSMDGSVVVWTEVRTKNPPTEVRHVYYLKGEQYAVVPLDVKYVRMRTWSRITLRGPEHVGTWRAAIFSEDGKLLGEEDFNVIR